MFFFCNDREIFIYIFDHNPIIIDEIKEVRLGYSFFLPYFIFLLYIYITLYSFVMIKKCLFIFSLEFFTSSIFDEIWKEVRSIINRFLFFYFYFSRIFSFIYSTIWSMRKRINYFLFLSFLILSLLAISRFFEIIYMYI